MNNRAIPQSIYLLKFFESGMEDEWFPTYELAEDRALMIEAQCEESDTDIPPLEIFEYGFSGKVDRK